MVTLETAKGFLRVDGDDEDALISSLIITAQSLVEEVLRRGLDTFDEIPGPIDQAILILTATLYEERQIKKSKDGIDIATALDFVKRLLFSYRKEAF